MLADLFVLFETQCLYGVILRQEPPLVRRTLLTPKISNDFSWAFSLFDDFLPASRVNPERPRILAFSLLSSTVKGPTAARVSRRSGASLFRGRLSVAGEQRYTGSKRPSRVFLQKVPKKAKNYFECPFSPKMRAPAARTQASEAF